MNNIIKHCLKGGLMSILVLCGFSACTDDHFDVANNAGTSGQTIWENIQANPQLTQMKDILSRTYMMRSETDNIKPSETKTIAEFLCDMQNFTVWAPVDGSYDYQLYIDLLDQADAELEANGVTKEYLRLQYQVASSFAYNHIARFSYEGNPEPQTVTMLNNKKVTYDAGKAKFNNISISATYPASNGTMHILGSASLIYNIYDYLSINPELSNLKDYIRDPSVERYTFSETMSTEGALNSNGEMVYVDSVEAKTNDIIDRCGARIMNEDSVYVAILPTNKAWDEAIAKLTPYFNYRDKYASNWNDDGGKFNYSGTSCISIGNKAQTAAAATDSLTSRNVKRSMIQDSFFSPSTWHPGGVITSYVDIYDSVAVNSYALVADSLISTDGAIFYNSTPGSRNEIFDGVEPVRASNGYMYCVDNYNIKPEYVWMKRNEINMQYESNLCQPITGYNATERKGSWQSLDLTSKADEEHVADPYELTGYRRFERKRSEANGKLTMSNDMTVDIKLTGLLSGDYTIKVIMAPTRIDRNVSKSNDDLNEFSSFYAEVYNDQDKNAIDIEIGNNGTKASDKRRSVDFIVDQTQVKEYVIIPKIHIPYCYYLLPDNISSFCRLRLTVPKDTNLKKVVGPNGEKYEEEAYDDLCSGLNIFKVIVEPYRGENAE